MRSYGAMIVGLALLAGCAEKEEPPRAESRVERKMPDFVPRPATRPRDTEEAKDKAPLTRGTPRTP